MFKGLGCLIVLRLLKSKENAFDRAEKQTMIDQHIIIIQCLTDPFLSVRHFY